MRTRPIVIRTDNGGVLKIIGKGKSACINFHSGGHAYSLVENSAALRKFFREALKRLELPKSCIFCLGDRVLMNAGGDPKKPMQAAPCGFCTPKGTTVEEAIAMREEQ